MNRGPPVACDATGSPHSKQNFAPVGSSLRHFVQVSATRAPHSRQNFACGGFSCWHRGHFTLRPPASWVGHAGGAKGSPPARLRQFAAGERRDPPPTSVTTVLRPSPATAAETTYFERIVRSNASTMMQAAMKASSFQNESRTLRTRAPSTSRRPRGERDQSLHVFRLQLRAARHR